VVLRARQCLHHGFDDGDRKVVVVGREDIEATAFLGHDPGIAHGLGGEAVLLAGLDPEEIAGQIEGTDLPPAIAQELGRPDSPLQDLVVIGGAIPSPKISSSLA
jgi:hypothetical protein